VTTADRVPVTLTSTWAKVSCARWWATSGSMPMDHTVHTVATVGPRGNRGTGGDSRRSGQRVPESPNKALVSDGQRDPCRGGGTRWQFRTTSPLELPAVAFPVPGHDAAFLTSAGR